MLHTNHLTNGEKLRIERRRAGNTQAKEAKLRALPLGAYKKLERGEASECYTLLSSLRGMLKNHETCMVLRLRKGLTQQQLADKIGVTKWWLCLMEQGEAPVATLLDHWTV